MPVWPCALSGRLPIYALVGRYPTNKLIGRGPLLERPKTFIPFTYVKGIVCGISSSFPELFPIQGQVIHVLLTRSPLYRPSRSQAFACDLHVLGAPPALILSRDQTLE